MTGWRDAGDGLVATEVDLPLDPSENALFVDGERAMEGRWPNSGPDPLNPSWAVAERTSTDQHIDDPTCRPATSPAPPSICGPGPTPGASRPAR
ncbi:hypothetical protein SAZ11_55235 [Streptomyces sp. FXJ1.4098]|nr:hypothetical protein [Streptomyces sp. FXJ1.4098]